MQDGDRAHTSSAKFKYLSTKGIEFIQDWPARSPDLNPIENLCAEVQRRVWASSYPETEAELRRAVEREWERIPQSTVDEYVLSFVRRLERCSANRGGPIKAGIVRVIPIPTSVFCLFSEEKIMSVRSFECMRTNWTAT